MCCSCCCGPSVPNFGLTLSTSSGSFDLYTVAGQGGARSNDTSTDGATNSGGGAGGQGANLSGQSGGSGVVVIRYTTANAPPGTSGGTKSTVGSCTVHVFTGPGTFSA